MCLLRSIGCEGSKEAISRSLPAFWRWALPLSHLWGEYPQVTCRYLLLAVSLAQRVPPGCHVSKHKDTNKNKWNWAKEKFRVATKSCYVKLRCSVVSRSMFCKEYHIGWPVRKMTVYARASLIQGFCCGNGALRSGTQAGTPCHYVIAPFGS